MDIDHRATGFDALRPDGRYLFVANHPFGGLDGLMLAAEVCERMGDVRVVANDLLMNIEPLRPIFLPVNKHGGQSGRVVEMCCRIFESDIPVVTFPAGLCSRRVAGRVVDLEWKSHFIKRAVMSRRDVVPVFFEGRLSDRFYRVAEWRRRLGVRSNVEMLLLVDEMFRQRGGRFEIRVGQPLAWQTLRERRTLHRMVELVRSQVYSMWRT